jgi:hypothetical protein
MKKNDVFTFTAPNGVEVTAVALYQFKAVDTYHGYSIGWICYAQNRIITIWEKFHFIEVPLNPPINGATYKQEEEVSLEFGKVIVEYCIIPELDELLEKHEENKTL